MKYFLIVCLFLSPSLIAKSNVLMIFPDQNREDVTSDLTALGISLAWKTSKTETTPELIRVHTDSNLKVMAEQVTAAIMKYQPVALIGAVQSNHALIISQITEEHHVPFVTPFSTAPQVTANKKYTIRVCFDDEYQVKLLAEYIYRTKKLKHGVILFNESQVYAVSVKDTFMKVFSKMSSEKLHVIPIVNESSVDSVLLEKLVKLKPEFILLPSYQTEAAAILSKLVTKLSKSTRYFGTDSWGGGRLFHHIVKSQAIAFEGYYVQHWSDEFSSAENKKFMKLIKGDEIPEKFRFSGAAMNAPIALGFDSGTAVLKALAQAGTVGDKRESLNHSLRNLDFTGVSGRITLHGGNTPKKPIFIYRIGTAEEHLVEAYE